LKVACSVNRIYFTFKNSTLTTFNEFSNICGVNDTQFALRQINVVFSTLFNESKEAATDYKPNEWIDDFLSFINYFNVGDLDPELP